MSKVLILYDHIREEHFSMSKDGDIKLNVLNTPNGKMLKTLLDKCSHLTRGRGKKDYEINFMYPQVPTPIKNDYGKIIKYQDVKQSEVKPYYDEMSKYIIENNIEVVVPTGKLGVKYLLNVSSIGSVRGVPTRVSVTHEEHSKDVWVLPTYSIEYTNVNKNSERHVVADLKLLGRYVENGDSAFLPKEVEYELVTDIKRVREIFNKEVKNDNHDGVDITAWDLETNSLKPDRKGSKPLVLSMSWKNGQGVTIPLYKSDFTWENGQQDIDEILGLLKDWLADKDDVKVAHNGQYDIKFLMSTQDFTDFERTEDTKVGWYLAVTQEKAESLRLTSLAFEVTDQGGYDKPLEDYKVWFLNTLLKHLLIQVKEIQKENKKIAKKEYDIKSTEYQEWIESKLQQGTNLENTDTKFKVSEEEKVYIELGLQPEVLTMQRIQNDELEKVLESSKEYMSLSNEAKSYVLTTAIDLINEFKLHTKVKNNIDGGNFNYDWIPLELMHPYASGDTDVCRRIYCDIIEKLEEQNRPKAMELLKVNYPRLTRTLARIESNGMHVDADYMCENDKFYEDEMNKTENKIREHWAVKEFEETRYNLYELALEEHMKKPKERDIEIHQYRAKYKDNGWMFSASSGAHKGEILYSILGLSLPYDKQYIKDKPFKSKLENEITWEDYKSDKTSISYLLEESELKDDVKELIELMLYYASMQTKRNSFTKKLPVIMNQETHNIHSKLNSTGTETGRLSSSDINTQNLPSHTSNVNRFDYHHPIKRSFTSRFDDGVLIGLDYSALEMRITALYTGDKDMLDMFLQGKDIHKNTASIMYGKPMDEITAEERQSSKAVAFGLIYGESEISFASKNNISVKEAEDIFDKFYSNKPSIKDSIEKTHEFVIKNGYVDTPTGHRRYIMSAMSNNKKERNEGLRQSFNTIIQGTGGFLTNMSLTYIDDFIQQKGLKSKIIATVHDSILIDCPSNEVELIGKVSKHIMENLPYDFLKTEINGVVQNYPIEADYEIGLTYNDMVEYDEEDIKTFKTYKGYIQYKLALQTCKDYFESGKLTEEQYKEKVEYLETQKEKFQAI